jgi:hypothetical protein
MGLDRNLMAMAFQKQNSSVVAEWAEVLIFG